MHIHEAVYQLGAANPSQFPDDSLPELAFAGRSNVGKSTLLNRLLQRKALARVSKTPGCTRLIQFYLINQRWRFVDLPGYGFAKVNLAQHQKWEEEMGRYLAMRRELRAVVLLLDSRRTLTDLDQQMIQFLDTAGVSYLPVATKIDKLNMSERRRNLLAIDQTVTKLGKLAVGSVVPCSAHNGAGMDQLWANILPLLGDETETARPPDPVAP